MDRDDVVEPADAARQALLALSAERIDDREKRDLIYDFMLTCSPVSEWPAAQDRRADTCKYVIGGHRRPLRWR